MVYIEFLTEFGDLPLLQADVTLIDNVDPALQPLTAAQIMDISEYQKGKYCVVVVVIARCVGWVIYRCSASYIIHVIC